MKSNDIVAWMLMNRDIIQQDISEIRRLIAKAETIICSKSDESELCERAKFCRSIVHDTPDPYNVKRGVTLLNDLVLAMKKRHVNGVDSLERDLSSFISHSEVLHVANSEIKDSEHADTSVSLVSSIANNFPQGQSRLEIVPVFEDQFEPQILDDATKVLDELLSEWSIGPYYMPIKGQQVMSDERQYDLFSDWYDSSYSHARNCIRELVGLDTDPFVGPTSDSIRAFDVLRAACKLAIANQKIWVAPLIRCLIVGAQELRRGGSTGMHGTERLRAKLIVGKLIGDLSCCDFEASLILADLTIESVSFSRSQVLYNQEMNLERLQIMIDRWSEENTPIGLDVLSEALVFAGDHNHAREVLEKGRSMLEKTPTNYLGQIYLARLARTLSLINLQDALKWSEGISSAPISLGCRFWCLVHGASISPSLQDAVFDSTRKLAEKYGLEGDDVSLPASELSKLPFTEGYPDFPPERWEELTAQNSVTYNDVFARPGY